MSGNAIALIIIGVLFLSAFLPDLRRLSRHLRYRDRASSQQPALYDPNQPYRVYCRDFDIELPSDKLDSVLGPEPARTAEQRVAAIESGLASWRIRNDFAALEAAGRIRGAVSAETLQDTAITLLVDHSGSMKGQRMLLTVGAVGCLSDMIDGLGVKQSVLGFTTVRWRGGESRLKWLRSGRPPFPGRLNDLLHIIYTDFDERPLGRRYATMLRAGLLKENIDGEALEWAAARMRSRPERHKHVIVISDGVPVDDSTILQNGEPYLEAHLRSVIRTLSEREDIRVSAIGIGYASDQYYASSVQISTPEDICGAALKLVEELLAPLQRPAAALIENGGTLH